MDVSLLKVPLIVEQLVQFVVQMGRIKVVGVHQVAEVVHVVHVHENVLKDTSSIGKNEIRAQYNTS